MADSKIQIIDDFIDQSCFKLLQKEIMSPFFDWYMADKIREKNWQEFLNTPDDNFNLQFIHVFISYMNQYDKSNYFPLLHPILDILRPVAINRIKVNCLPKTETLQLSGFHTDIDISKVEDSNPKTAIFYINDSNGYTLFEDGTKVKSKENRICIFPYYLKHAGTTCTDRPSRILINFLYVK